MESIWFETARLAQGWARDVRISHDAGRITRIETSTAARSGDERGTIALPGLTNLHSHGFQRGMAGMAETRGPADDDFWTWREVMYRFLGRLSPDDVEAITALAYVEMLETGFTRVCEFHYLHNDPQGARYDNPAEMAGAIVRAARASGIGLTLLPVFYAHGGFGGLPARDGQRRFVMPVGAFADLMELSRRLARTLDGTVVGVAPHSLRAVTAEELALVAPLAAGGPIHIHAAEQTGEVDACLAWSGARPVEWLLDNADVSERWCLIHATHLTAEETFRLARSGAVAGLCPITEANLGDGVFPASRFMSAGGRWGVGTDSNVLIDAAGEMRAVEYAQRLEQRSRNVLAAKEGASIGAALFAGALAGGALASGAGASRLGEGEPATLVSLDGGAAGFAGAQDDATLDRWIFATSRNAVERVWRSGVKVVEGGRHVARENVERDYRASLTRLLAD